MELTASGKAKAIERAAGLFARIYKNPCELSGLRSRDRALIR
ncbi:MAG: hypothetical protein WBA39_19850 [Rivularia sp. (in: cyanobacteria)]